MTSPQSNDHDLLIRMDTKLDVLVGTVNKQGEAIGRLEQTQASHSERLTRLETQGETEETATARHISARVLFWTAGGTMVLAASLLISVWIRK